MHYGKDVTGFTGTPPFGDECHEMFKETDRHGSSEMALKSINPGRQWLEESVQNGYTLPCPGVEMYRSIKHRGLQVANNNKIFPSA